MVAQLADVMGGRLSQWPAGTCCFSPYGAAVAMAYPVLHSHSRVTWRFFPPGLPAGEVSSLL